MYDSLSPKLEITLEKESDKNKNPVEEDKKEVEISKTIDLRGVKCPINFVKAKIEMSKITSGEEIGFLLDDGEPIDNVPRSLEGEGHQILDIDTNYEGYNLLTVKKK
jgi:sulfite reductase (ferredoxin)